MEAWRQRLLGGKRTFVSKKTRTRYEPRIPLTPTGLLMEGDYTQISTAFDPLHIEPIVWNRMISVMEIYQQRLPPNSDHPTRCSVFAFCRRRTIGGTHRQECCFSLIVEIGRLFQPRIAV